MENTLINSYCIDFFYCNKKQIVKAIRQELLHRPNKIKINQSCMIYLFEKQIDFNKLILIYKKYQKLKNIAEIFFFIKFFCKRKFYLI